MKCGMLSQIRINLKQTKHRQSAQSARISWSVCVKASSLDSDDTLSHESVLTLCVLGRLALRVSRCLYSDLVQTNPWSGSNGTRNRSDRFSRAGLEVFLSVSVGELRGDLICVSFTLCMFWLWLLLHDFNMLGWCNRLFLLMSLQFGQTPSLFLISLYSRGVLLMLRSDCLIFSSVSD